MSVQRFNKVNSDNQPFHIYYDMNVINNDSSFPAKPVRFQYKETRSNYFLLCPQDYFMSIVRFNLQTPTLPVFIPQINLNPNTNFGGKFPIQSMSGANNTSFTTNFYTNIPIAVGNVLFLSLSNGATTSIHETSGVNNNYYRVSQATTSNFGITSLILENPAAVGGVPNNYAGGTTTAFSLLGGTIQAGYAVLPVANLVYSPTTQLLTLTYTSQPNLTDLTNLFRVGDGLYINNAGQYNNSYTIRSVSALSMTLATATSFSLQSFYSSVGGVFVNNGLNAYSGSGFFTSSGDFYNQTPYNITLSYNYAGVGAIGEYTQAITYLPNDLTTSPPSWNPQNAQALSLEQITSDYYWIYNYEVFIKMVNQAFTNAFWGVNGSIYATSGALKPWTTASGNNADTYQPPSMSWNQDSLKGIITADNSIFGITALTTTASFMYFNQPFSTLFDSFPYQYPDETPDSLKYSYVVFDTNSGAGLYVVSSYSSLGVITPKYTAIQVYQDHQTASLMNPVQSISFTSTLLPVVVENVGQPSILNGTAPTNVVIGSTANVFPVITDFQVPFSATDTYVPDISYVPSSEYRLVDLYGESPANQIDVQVFWKDQYGLLHPFLLGSGCSGNLKIMFRRKDYNDVNISE
jgi:hypothetical protein